MPYVDDKSPPCSWVREMLNFSDSKLASLGTTRQELRRVLRAYRESKRVHVEDFDTAQGCHVHIEKSGEYEAITESCGGDGKAD